MPRQQKRRRTTKRSSSSRRRKKTSNFYIFRLISICILIGIGVFYLMQIGKSSTTVYEANDLKRQIKELKNKKEILELETVKLKSMANINERLGDMKMVAVEKIEYIEGEKAVAVK
jgi:hypothetical protein